MRKPATAASAASTAQTSVALISVFSDFKRAGAAADFGVHAAAS